MAGLGVANGVLDTPIEGSKPRKRGYLDPLYSGPGPSFGRPEAYRKPENAGIAGRAVVGSSGTGTVLANVRAGHGTVAVPWSTNPIDNAPRAPYMGMYGVPLRVPHGVLHGFLAEIQHFSRNSAF